MSTFINKQSKATESMNTGMFVTSYKMIKIKKGIKTLLDEFCVA